MDNEVSINFSEGKTKLILFTCKQISKNALKLNNRHNHINIKQHSKVTYLWCVIDKPMALKVIKKINGKLKLPYEKNRYLIKKLCRMLCNALIQPHFDYAFQTRYSNANENEKTKYK